MQPKKQTWRDNTEPPKNYIWERLNDSGSYIGTFVFNGERWVKIKDSESSSGGSGSCNCNDKFVAKSNTASIVYGTDKTGSQTTLPYSETITANTVVKRNASGRIKSKDAAELDDVLTLKALVWNE